MQTRTRLSVMIAAVVVASAAGVAGAAAVSGFPGPSVGRVTIIAAPTDADEAAARVDGDAPPPVAQAPAGDLGGATPTATPLAAAAGTVTAPVSPRAAARASARPKRTPPPVPPGAQARRGWPTGSAASADNLASRLRTLPAATRQVIIVHAESYNSTNATVETFQRYGDRWLPVFGRLAARIGSRGFRDDKTEGDLSTPTGVYPIGATMYGVAPDPGVRYPYHRLVEHDYWNGNSDSPQYNSFVHGSNPGGASEALWKITPQYNYFAVIDYNVPAVPDRGSAIFLHVMVAGRATAGCVSMAEADLLRVLRWLSASAAPRIVLAPAPALGRY